MALFVTLAPALSAQGPTCRLDRLAAVEVAELRNARCVTSAIEIRGEEDMERLDSDPLRRDGLSEAGDIRVVMTTGHLRVIGIADDAAPGAGHLIHRHADPLAAAADRDSEVGPTAHNCVRHRSAVVGVVDAVRGVGAEILDHVVLGSEPCLERLLEEESGVV